MSSLYKKSKNNIVNIEFSEKEVTQIINLLENTSKILYNLSESYKDSEDKGLANAIASKALSLTSLVDLFIESSEPGKPSESELN